jgi:5-methylthioadenosine/S-adenosylhomocysteine deaminase
MNGGEVLIRGGQVVAMDDAGTEGLLDVRVVDGRIVEVGKDLEIGAARVLDASGCAVLPGFVQTHVHLCQTLFRNLADDRALLEWLAERVWPLEASHSAASLRASADLGIAELLLGGTTAIVDMGTVHHTEAVFEALAASGLRAVAGKCMMDDPSCPDGLREGTEASLAESLALAERWDGFDGGRIRYGFAPRFILSCTPGLMREVAREARARGLFVHTHSSENKDEIAIVAERTGTRNVLALASYGIAGEKTILAHCIHLDEAERRELATSGTRVAHCPSSNLKLGSGICDVVGLMAEGVHVSLGADGAPCNNRLDQWTELRTAALLQKPIHGPTALGAQAALRLATRAGAEAIGLGAELGQVAVGMLADLQVVGLDDVLAGPGGPVASRLVYGTERSAVRHVLVQGQVLVEDGKLTRMDKAEVGARARRELAGCLERSGLSV